MQVIDFGGAPMTVWALEKILTLLDEKGELVIKGISPQSAGMLQLGAILAEMGRRGVQNVG